MSEYAKRTKISITQSMQEIQEVLNKHGITRFMIELERNEIYFNLNDKPVKISVPTSKKSEFYYTATGQRRSDSQVELMFEQDIKARWRLMKEYIKLELELVRLNIMSIEQAFLSNYVLLNGKTLGEEFVPKLKDNTADLLKLPEGKKNE